MRIGILFPGQGAPVRATAPHLVQAAIVTASLSGLRALEQLGIEPAFAVGHSLGELSALHWAGAFDRRTVLELVEARGRAMSDEAVPAGAMASLVAPEPALRQLLAGRPLTVACDNSPTQRVVSGEPEPVEDCIAAARAAGVRAVRLRVGGAFHSPLMAVAAPAFEAALAAATIRPPRRPVVSTVTGDWLQGDEDLRELLLRQLTSPVRFRQAVERCRERADLLIEVGPGRTLSVLAGESTGLPTLPVEAGGSR